MFFRKKIQICLLATLALSCSLIYSASAGTTISNGELKVGSDLTYPPYNYFAKGNVPAGFDVELMTAIAKKAGLKISFQDTRFENLIIGVNSGQFDVIASTLYVKPDRAKVIDYVPYMKSGISIAVVKGSKLSFSSLDDLCGQIIGSVKGSAWLEHIAKLNKTKCSKSKIDAREFPTAPEVTQALLSGAINAQIEDSAVLGAAQAKLKGRLVITNKKQLYPVIIGFGLRKGNAELAKVLRSALEELKKDGSYKELLGRYNVDSPTEEEFQKAMGK